MITAVPVSDVFGGFSFEVDGGPVHEHHVKSDIVFFFEDVKEVAEDLVFVFSKDGEGSVKGVVFKGGEMEVVQERGVAGHPVVASADGEVFGHLVGGKSDDESAESMAAVFEAIEEWCEVKVFEKGCNGL